MKLYQQGTILGVIMKKVSAKMFFAVIWRGLCQALGWFFGLFGYKRDGKFAKCVWGLFATSATVTVSIFALLSLYKVGTRVYEWYDGQNHGDDAEKFEFCDNDDCYEDTYICNDICFHKHDGEDGYIYNSSTRELYLNHVTWIDGTINEDSLVCFSNGKKRGYFSTNTCKVAIEPKYDHAWIFSDGLAGVEVNGCIKFIDTTGKIVLDTKMPYHPNNEGYVFHGDYCIVNTKDGQQYGLMDKTGKIVLPLEYSDIKPDDSKMWIVQKGEESIVLNKELQPVIPFINGSIYIDEGTIDVTMKSDHTIRKYDFEGKLIHDFYIFSVHTLEYKKDDISYRTITHDDEGNEYAVPYVESYHPEATARLRAYVAGDGYEGLMTNEGRVVTKPLYTDIEAIGYDLYLCTYTNFDKLIVNGKGEIVR